MAKEPAKAAKIAGSMTNDDTPIGMSADGKGLNIVDADAPPFKPKVFDAEGNEIDPDAIEPDAAADE